MDRKIVFALLLLMSLQVVLGVSLDDQPDFETEIEDEIAAAVDDGWLGYKPTNAQDGWLGYMPKNAQDE
uniref:Uncharacterized LOC100177814 n=1 Tax=Ciona intestinalis TaxID=7719 RepID=H2XWD6_CIOIN